MNSMIFSERDRTIVVTPLRIHGNRRKNFTIEALNLFELISPWVIL